MDVNNMRASEIIRQLRDNGRTCQSDPYINSEGQLILLVDHVAMFLQDAEDLLRGRATIEGIIERNNGNNLGWTYPMTGESRNR